ncbi:MAG: glycerol-3-phosphate 1-O-acyltransferase PlsY [Oscillospiraceae bacterium]
MIANANVGLAALAFVLSALGGYVLGSISFAVLICKVFFKEDVRSKGSGNAGMTNVLRSFGKKGAVLTLLGDVGKGILAVWIGRWVFMLVLPGIDVLYGAYVAGIFAIVGHMFPVFFGFKGGKGVATSGGVILALQPVVALILLSVFLLLVFLTKMVSLGSVIGMSLYPLATLVWCLKVSYRAPVFSTLCAAVISILVVFMHRANIQRIFAGTEYKFGSKPPKPETRPQKENEQ